MVRRTLAVLLAITGVPIGSLLVAQERPTSGGIPSTDGIQLHYQVHGQGSDPVVVLHGGPGLSLRYLWPDLEPLARGRRLIFYDQRGGGRSTIPSDDALITAAKHVEDLEEVRKFFGLERLTLVGHSWGANLAALYADRYPARIARMLLIDPGPPRHEPYIKQFEGTLAKAWGPETLKQIEKLGAELEKAQDPTPTSSVLRPPDPALPRRSRDTEGVQRRSVSRSAGRHSRFEQDREAHASVLGGKLRPPTAAEEADRPGSRDTRDA